MEKQDARRLEPAAQYELRKQVIRAWKRGRNRVQISEEIGLSYVAVCNIVKRYRMSEDKSLPRSCVWQTPVARPRLLSGP